MAGQVTPQPNVSELELSPRLWFIIILIGAGAGVAGGLLMKLLRVVQHLSYGYTTGEFLDGVQRASGTHRVLIMFAAGVLAGLVLLASRRLSARSSSELSGAIWMKFGRLGTAATIVHLLLSIVTVGMGAALGREGAFKEAGAVIANKLSDWTRFTDTQRHLLVACGAGAGMAAAYNVPFGGALFAAEVLLGSISLETILPACAASFTAVVLSWIMLPDAPTYSFPLLQSSTSTLIWSIVAGPILGFLSIGYVNAVAWAQTHKPRGWHIVGLPVLVFTLLGFAAIKFPQVLGNGKDVVQMTFSDRFGAGLLCWLIVLRPLATMLCLRTGAPGGLFTPTVTFGALLGDGGGRLWNHLWPGSAVPGYALIGSGAFLAAATMGPLSSVAFLLELTQRADGLMVPLLIGAVGATVTARAHGVRSMYSAKIIVSESRKATAASAAVAH